MNDATMDEVVRKFHQTAFRGPNRDRVDVVLPSGAELHLQLAEVWFSYYHDDGRVWLFDVTKARVLGEEQALAREAYGHIRVRDLAESPAEWLTRCRGLDTERAIRTNLLDPITAVLIEGAHLLIDGCHRVYHALATGVPILYISIIDQPEQVEAVTIAKLSGEAAEFCRRADL